MRRSRRDRERAGGIRLTAPASEHAANGKAARKQAKRSAHRAWAPAPDRPSPRRILAAQDAARVPDLVPIRYGRMLASPFSFFRGAGAIMAVDLAATPRSGLEAQLCGDAHLSNFGVFAAPDRDLIFDINDFDETLPGPFEWDVKRLAASFAVAGRERGFGRKDRRAATVAALRAYRKAMRRFARMRDLEVWYARLEVEETFELIRSRMSRKQIEAYERSLGKARQKDSKRALSKLCRRVDGAYRIVGDPPLIVPVAELTGSEHFDEIEPALQRLLRAYQRTLPGDRRLLVRGFRYADAARKVVGVGSVGTEAWIVLLFGRDSDDPLVLQAKQAQRSVLEPFAGKSRFTHQGQRVVEGQRLMQAASDIFLGWVSAEGERGDRRDYYVRQLWDGKQGAEVDLLGAEELRLYGRLCGWTLARAHARSGDRVAIASYLGGGSSFDDAVAGFAEAYADQNERDYESLLGDVKAGELVVTEGV